MYGDFLLPFLVFWPITGGIAASALGRRSGNLRDAFAFFTAAAELAVFIALFATFGGHGARSFSWDGFCGLGINFTLDGFRLIFGTLAAFIWTAVSLSMREYFSGARNMGRYCFFNLFTFGAAIGVFFAADLFTAFIFFEVMGLTSYVTVINEETPSALRAGETYIAVTIIGGMVMLMGMFLLYSYADMPQVSGLAEVFAAAEDKRAFYIAGALILAGYGVKAGMFPLHIWLPDSYASAPAPATTVLSGILSKAGVFGILILCSNMFLHDKGWGMAMLALAAATMGVASVMAVLCSDLKRTLAFSSMSQIGFILMGCAMQGILGDHNALAVRGTLLHMVNHSLIKLVLFTAAGVIFMNTGSLDLNAIKGYGRNKPLLAFSFMMGALGIAGVPLWNGYVSKTLLHESIVEYIALLPDSRAELRLFQAVEVFFVFCGGMTAAYMAKLSAALFLDSPADEKPDGRGKNYMNGVTAFALAAPALLLPVLGMLPNLLMDGLADMGQGFMNGESPHHAVHYFSWINIKGTLYSLLTGAAVYLLVVRTCLIRTDGNGRRVYINAWPSRVSLERLFYRPLLGVAIWIGAFFSRVADRGTNVGVIIWLGAFFSRLADTVTNIHAMLWLGTFASRLADSLTNMRLIIWLGSFLSRLADSAANMRVILWAGAFFSRLADSLPFLANRPVRRVLRGARARLDSGDIPREESDARRLRFRLAMLLFGLCAGLLLLFLVMAVRR